MDIKENLDSVVLGGVEQPLDMVLGSISATNVWSVLPESPVTDWETDNLDFSVGKVLDEVLSDPALPMSLEDSVSLLWSKSLTESVLVHTNTLRLSLAKESVEETWGNPRLKDLPSTEVGSNHGFSLDSSNSSCSKVEDRFH